MIIVDLDQNFTKTTKIKAIRRFTVIVNVIIKNSIIDLHNFNWHYFLITMIAITSKRRIALIFLFLVKAYAISIETIDYYERFWKNAVL